MRSISIVPKLNAPKQLISSLLFLVATSTSLAEPEVAAEINVAVIGGLEMSGFWSEMASIAEDTLDIRINTVLAAPKERVVPAFMNGDADVLLMHGGDETFALEAQGYSGPLQTWGYNAFVIVGPIADPAGIAAAESGAEAMLKLQASGAPLISFRDVTSAQLIRRLLDTAGLYPRDINLINDTAGRPQNILLQAQRDQAYVIVGHMPVAFNRMPSDGTKILLEGDPAMRRAYVVLTPGPSHPASALTRDAAERFAEFLTSDEGQNAIQAIPGDAPQWILNRGASAALIQFRR